MDVVSEVRAGVTTSGAEASWLCRKGQRTGLPALVDNIRSSGEINLEVSLDLSALTQRFC